MHYLSDRHKNEKRKYMSASHKDELYTKDKKIAIVVQSTRKVT